LLVRNTGENSGSTLYNDPGNSTKISPMPTTVETRIGVAELRVTNIHTVERIGVAL